MLVKMYRLFSHFPEIDLGAMGFPKGWEQEPLWISPEIANMTLSNRKKVSDNIKENLYTAMKEKYK